MITIPLALVANNTNGLGGVKETLLTGAMLNLQTTQSIFAWRKDRSTGGSNFTDISSVLGSDAANDAAPFNVLANMSGDDELLIACSHPELKEIWFNVGTAGVFNADGLEVFVSTDGKTANTQLTNITDNTNAFRTSGLNKISWTRPSGMKAWSPVPGDVPEKYWFVFKLKNFTSATTAPLLSRIYIIHDIQQERYINIITNISGDPTVAPSQNPANIPLVGDEAIYTFNNRARALEVYSHLAQSNIYTYIWEYLATGGVWTALSNVVDGSAGFSVGPAVMTATATHETVAWDIPSDWTSQTITKTNAFSASSILAIGFHIRIRATVVSNPNPIVPPHLRLRVRQYGAGNASGIKVAARTISRASLWFRGIKSGTNTAARVILLSNFTKGETVNLSIPTTTVQNDTLAVATNIAFVAEDELGIEFKENNGSANYQDVLMFIE